MSSLYFYPHFTLIFNGRSINEAFLLTFAPYFVRHSHDNDGIKQSQNTGGFKVELSYAYKFGTLVILPNIGLTYSAIDIKPYSDSEVKVFLGIGFGLPFSREMVK